MREAIGGSWMMYIMIIFLLVSVFLICFVMNYASAYRAANYVVTRIENCHGDMDDCDDNNLDKNLELVTNEVRQKYHYIERRSGNNGIITPCCVPNGSRSVFRVKLGVVFDVPFLSNVRLFDVSVETKTLDITCSESGLATCQ